jgi:hypothetical protein
MGARWMTGTSYRALIERDCRKVCFEVLWFFCEGSFLVLSFALRSLHKGIAVLKKLQDIFNPKGLPWLCPVIYAPYS